MIQIKVSRLTLSCAGETYPALEYIPAMQRRRLSPMAKMALNSAIQSLADTRVDYIVWASQYGDETRTCKILEDVLQAHTPSPTQFSTSVHNAVAGLYSILCQDSTASTSLCASWSEALIEAYAFLKTASDQAQALVVYYDEPLPDIYVEHQQFQGFAVAAVIALQQPDLYLNLDALVEIEPKYQDALNFYHCWTQDQHHPGIRVWP
ncbi:beta-ketoacyl synthase chain length factor [Acinetobacter sp. WZC-1]|uniref:beta-ketoacyl synthase chain length factor n=1 Tax=Acinetobacter sp. WZC-1 TaxID=3459034 RepID=UPI00403DDA52